MAWVLAGEQNSCYTLDMKTKPNTHTDSIKVHSSPKFTHIKLGVDVHADYYVVVRQIDSSTPQPAQRIKAEQFLAFAARQLELAEQVHSCYEAGPFGYCLHRGLEALGIHNLVVRPQNWDELHKGVKTDRTDALALVQRLDRYVQGNQRALAVIAVPTAAQEQARVQTRQREQVQQARQRHEAQGRSLLLSQGWRVKGAWWKGRLWEVLQARLPEWLRGSLETLRSLVVHADELLQQISLEIERTAQPQPKGFGLLTTEVLRREVLDWGRFKNR